MTLTATIRQTPAPGARHVDDMLVDALVETAPTYADALGPAEKRLPEGWQIIALRTKRDT